ncbi:hypothetical protein Hanom_Chr06g00478021 [Helianthus anomalus]
MTLPTLPPSPSGDLYIYRICIYICLSEESLYVIFVGWGKLEWKRSSGIINRRVG